MMSIGKASTISEGKSVISILILLASISLNGFNYLKKVVEYLDFENLTSQERLLPIPS